MLRGDRGIIFAIVGWLVFAVFITFSSNNSKQEGYPQYRYATDKPAEIDPATAGVSNSQPFEYRRPCQNPKGEDESDLCAQWRAAKAAEHSAFWTKWGFWIAVVGSSLLLWQIILTRKAVEDTGDATKAMKEANEIARDAIARQAEPWLEVTVDVPLLSPVEMFPPSDADPHTVSQVTLTTNPIVKNFATAPALVEWFEAFVIGADIKYSTRRENCRFAIGGGAEESLPDFAGRAQIDVGTWHPTPERHLLGIPQSTVLHIKLGYRDALGNERTLHSQFWVGPTSKPTPLTASVSKGYQ